MIVVESLDYFFSSCSLRAIEKKGSRSIGGGVEARSTIALLLACSSLPFVTRVGEIVIPGRIDDTLVGLRGKLVPSGDELFSSPHSPTGSSNRASAVRSVG